MACHYLNRERCFFGFRYPASRTSIFTSPSRNKSNFRSYKHEETCIKCSGTLAVPTFHFHSSYHELLILHPFILYLTRQRVKDTVLRRIRRIVLLLHLIAGWQKFDWIFGAKFTQDQQKGRNWNIELFRMNIWRQIEVWSDEFITFELFWGELHKAQHMLHAIDSSALRIRFIIYVLCLCLVMTLGKTYWLYIFKDWRCHRNSEQCIKITIRERCKKKIEKKLTNVSFM